MNIWVIERNKICLLLVVSGLFLCCGRPSEPLGDNSPSLEFLALTDGYAEEWLALHPLHATRMGDSRFNDQLADDISADYLDELQKVLEKYQDRLAGTDTEKLNDRDFLTYELLDYSLKIDLEGLKYNLQRGSWLDWIKPIHQWAASFPTSFLVQASGSGYIPFKTVEDYDNFRNRLKLFVVKIETAIDNMRSGLKTGDTHPQACMLKVVPQLDALISGSAQESLFFRPVLKMPPEIQGEAKDRIILDYTRAITEDINPAYRRLRDFMRDEYIPGCRATSGLSSTPEGREKYAYLIRYFTTTDKTPDEIYEIGLKEVARIRDEMDKIRVETGLSGDLAAFFKFVKTDPQFFPFNTVEEVLDTFDGFTERINPRLKEFFTLIPKSRLEVRATEKFREGGTNAYYAGPTADDPNVAVFYEPVPDPNKYHSITMESLYLHEGIPGHHFQMSLHRESDLPKIRKFIGFDAYSEGWALYVESLGKELGFYQDPYQVLGRLSNEMERAVRLVVDVGLHWKGWTREQAIRYILDNQPVDESTAIKRTERYMVAPGQAISYKIGEIKMMEIRRNAEQKLKNRFDLRTFHNEVLKYGPLPLTILEARIDRWIDETLSQR
ncbi:MAG: DUF885 domain-containing protein [Candidatus Aminicenantaceae bacterium]